MADAAAADGSKGNGGAGKGKGSKSGGKGAAKAAGGAVRCVVQRCNEARLLVDNEDEWIEAGRGLVVYLSFKDGATDAAVAKLVKTLLTVRLIPSGDSGRPASAVECATQAEGAWAPDLLVVPQACLSGKAKGKQVQYHGQLAKDEGARMYAAFVELLQSQAAALVAGSGGGGKAKARGADGDDESKGGEGEVPAVTVPRVLAGTYGNRQGLELKTDGPMTHFFEF